MNAPATVSDARLAELHGDELHYCAGASCPGLTYRASDRPHPAACNEAPLFCAEGVPVSRVRLALAQYGMTVRFATRGRLVIERAHLTRDEALRLNRENAGDMHFTPFDGYCYCGADIVEQVGLHAIAAGANVTGCRKCNRSYCD